MKSKWHNLRWYDCIITGGGANGINIAERTKEAEPNYSVLVIERGFIGNETSANSSDIAHGGLRYTENPSNWPMVFNALKDREKLVNEYSDFSYFDEFYFLVEKNAKVTRPMIKTGLILYDIFSLLPNVIHWGDLKKVWQRRHKKISIEDFHRNNPRMAIENIRHIYQYWDGRTDGLKLTRAIAQKARELGVEILENTNIKSILMENEVFVIKTDNGFFCTNKLVNATGPWVSEFAKRFHLPQKTIMTGVSGIHIKINKVLCPHPLFLEKPKSRNLFFILPERKKDCTWIGTTERTEPGRMDNVTVQEGDIQELIDSVNHYLTAEMQITGSDIVATKIGVRALAGTSTNTNAQTRNPTIDVFKINGICKYFVITGGKLTGASTLAKKVVKKLLKNF